MTSSGATLFDPSLGDLVIEAYSRIQVRPSSFTRDHMVQARMSASLLLSEWNVKPDPPNLWKISLIQIPLIQGVPTYDIPKNVVALLDAYVRQFQMQTPINQAPNFSTTLNSAVVTVEIANNGLAAGEWVAIVIPVAIAGLVLLGFYQINSVIDPNNFTIIANAEADSTVSNGGVVPVFTTTAASAIVNVEIPNHGLVRGENFTVQVPTQVDGLTLASVYAVTAVIDSDNFTITAPQPAGANATASENGGQAQFQLQNTATDPIDRILFPISRTEYAQQPDKFAQAFPSTFWWNRQIDSVVTFWNVPDGNGPYVFFAYVMTQIEDAQLEGGVGLDLPNRFLEAFAAGLAAKLARKFPPPPPVTVADLKAEAELAWQAAAKQDTENVPLFITPGMSGYWR